MSSAILEKATQTLRWLLNILLLQSIRNDHIAWVACVQVCSYDFQCTHTCRHRMRMGKRLTDELRLTLFKVGLHRVGLTLSSRWAWSSGKKSQDSWRSEGMQELLEGDKYASQLSVDFTPDFLLEFTPLYQEAIETDIHLPDFMIWFIYIYIHITEHLSVKVNRSKFIIWSRSSQIDVH